MTITVRYQGQLRQAAGVVSEVVSCPGSTVLDLIRELAGRRASLEPLLSRRPSLLVFVNDRHADDRHSLSDGDEVVLMTPIAGGAA